MHSARAIITRSAASAMARATMQTTMSVASALAAPAAAAVAPCASAVYVHARTFASKSGSPNAAGATAAHMKPHPHPQPHVKHPHAHRRAPQPPAKPLVPKAAVSGSSSRGAAQSRAAGLPTFNSIMKRFNLLVHPDLFMTSPAQAHQNQQSLQALNSLLAGLKTRDPSDPYPPKQVLQLLFYIKKKRGDEAWAAFIRKNDVNMYLEGRTVSPTAGSAPRKPGARAHPLPARGHSTLENEFHIVPTLLSTNGGHCKRAVADQMASLFYRVGLPAQFKWDDEYWNMGGARDQKFAEGEEGEGEDKAAADDDGADEGEEWKTSDDSDSKQDSSRGDYK